MKKFLEAVSQNSDLTAKASTMTKENLLALAQELGIELTGADLTRPAGEMNDEADFEKPAGELNDDELNAIAGGGECFGYGNGTEGPA